MLSNKSIKAAISNLCADSVYEDKLVSHFKDLFESIDPAMINTEFERAISDDDAQNAIRLLANYYRNKPDNTVPDTSAKGNYDARIADNASIGVMREVNIDWTFEEGKIDFLFDPTAILGVVNHEWLWQFNRHSYWCDMARAYVATGNEKYAKAFRYQLLTWISTTEAPKYHNAPGSAWRTIEAGIRLFGSWQVAFDGFRRSPSIEDSLLVLMVASMLRQTRHLLANPTRGNWLMMEMNGVYTFSALFTEVKDSFENRRIATDYLLREMQSQILPDGMHNELSPDYQLVVVSCASRFALLARSLGYGDEIPGEFIDLIKKTTNAAILLSTPAFTQPRTNDTFTMTTEKYVNRACAVVGELPEYVFVKSGRVRGCAPAGENASVFLPYSGFAVMRSDWGADSSYLCFDVGPLGMAHMHQDKLNVNIYKGSEELIYDDGGGQYDLSEVRKYAISGYSHNVATVDGLAQYREEPRMTDIPIDADWQSFADHDYASGTYNDGYGEASSMLAAHKREVRFEKPDLFLIRDTLTSMDGLPHDYELRFHLDTTSVRKIDKYKNAVVSDYGRNYDVAIIPLDGESEEVNLTLETAITEPMYSGWYNGRNESNLHPSTTVRRAVKGRLEFVFTTLVIPIRSDDLLPDVIELEDGMVIIKTSDREYKVNKSYLK